MFSRDLRSDPKKLVCCVAALTLGFVAVMWIAAVTPRARLNVMQAVSVVFLTTVAWRFRGARGTRNTWRALIPWGCALSRLRFAERPYSREPQAVGAVYDRPHPESNDSSEWALLAVA